MSAVLRRFQSACRTALGRATPGTRHRHAIAFELARLPTISAWFFVAFKEAIGSGSRCGLPPWSMISHAQARSGRLVEPDGLILELVKIAGEIIRSTHVGEFLQRVTNIVAELGRLDIERWPAFERHHRERERKGRG